MFHIGVREKLVMQIIKQIAISFKHSFIKDQNFGN